MDFNSVAPYYDVLSKIVFGSTLEKVKCSLFENIPVESNILFIGGGTGVSLVKLLNSKGGLKIDFVDSSAKMISKAKNRVGHNSHVRFHSVPIQNFNGKGYDIIITEFFFDLFNQIEAEELITAIKLKLKKTGIWIDTDFRKPKTLKNKWVLKWMYWFFMHASNIKVNELVGTKPIFKKNFLKLTEEKKSKSNFVSSRQYLHL